jgi:hypothetical protein
MCAFSYNRAIAQVVSRRLLIMAARFRAQVSVVRIVMDKVILGQVFFRVRRFPPVSIIPPLLKFTHVSSGAWTMGPLAVQFHRHTV